MLDGQRLEDNVGSLVMIRAGLQSLQTTLFRSAADMHTSLSWTFPCWLYTVTTRMAEHMSYQVSRAANILAVLQHTRQHLVCS